MRKFSKLLFIGAPLLAGGLLFFQANDRPIVFESEESKTEEGGPVFNRVHFISRRNQDIWMMQQSHSGRGVPFHTWDRVAIVVEKTKTPKQARFIQLEPGPLEWSETAKKREFRVSCFMCHANGPRAIRPDYGSKNVKVSLGDSLRIKLLNLRINAYGRVLYDPIHDEEDKVRQVPFRFQGALENNRLTVASCTKCHSDSGLFSRGYLRRQHAITMEFMLSNRHMPPLWFRLSDADRAQIERFASVF